MAQPLASARQGALGAAGGAAGAAIGHSIATANSPASRSSTSEGWQQAEETGKLLAAGGVAGAVSKSATAPLARLTILYQARTEKLAPTWFSILQAVHVAPIAPPKAATHPLQLFNCLQEDVNPGLRQGRGPPSGV